MEEHPELREGSYARLLAFIVQAFAAASIARRYRKWRAILVWKRRMSGSLSYRKRLPTCSTS
jgi:dsRNA-specific ribonuclease